MRRGLPGLLVLLLSGHTAARTWRTDLVAGFEDEFKFLAKFAFTTTTSQAPGTIFLRAWTFMAGQRVLMYENDAWFRAQNVGSLPFMSLCEHRAALMLSRSKRIHVPSSGFEYG